MIDKKARAKKYFIHYMTYTWEQVGIEVSSDNISEWESLIDSIIDAAVEEVSLKMFQLGRWNRAQGNGRAGAANL